MPTLFKVLRYLPISRERKAAWRRELLDRAYGADISAARKVKDNDKVMSLKRDHQYEMQLDQEDEDETLTRYLIREASRLHVPTPHFANDDGSESVLWYEGALTHRRLLTPEGVAHLRDEIRREKKARHELKAVLIPWISALTGIVGAITGLVALLLKSGYL